MKARIKLGVFVAFLILSLASCAHSKSPQIALQVFEKNKGWGYKILLNKKCYIYQEYIPAIEGNIPFANRKDAELVGRLIIKKILNKETPTVDTGELRQLDIKGTS